MMAANVQRILSITKAEYNTHNIEGSKDQNQIIETSLDLTLEMKQVLI